MRGIPSSCMNDCVPCQSVTHEAHARTGTCFRKGKSLSPCSSCRGNSQPSRIRRGRGGTNFGRVPHGEIQHPRLRLRFRMLRQSTWKVKIQRVVKVCTSLRDNLFIYYSLQSTPRLIILDHSNDHFPTLHPYLPSRQRQPLIASLMMLISALQSIKRKNLFLGFLHLMVSYSCRFRRYFEIYQTQSNQSIAVTVRMSFEGQCPSRIVVLQGFGQFRAQSFKKQIKYGQSALFEYKKSNCIVWKDIHCLYLFSIYRENH